MRRLSTIVLSTVGVVAALATAIATTGSAEASTRPAVTAGWHAQHTCAPATKGFATCFAEVLVPGARSGAASAAGADAIPNASAPPAAAVKPSQLRTVYHLGSASSGGKTVALVDAYGYPNLERDLSTYRSYFGLPACTTASGCLTIMNQTGGSTPPAFNLGWAQETSLDVDAVSAACPDCKILVVEAKSPSTVNLGTAVNTAAAQPGVVAISNSYGGSDDSDSADGHYYNHPGIAVTASTGDDGYQGASFPASSDYVTAVGGTSLTLDKSAARGVDETAWSDAGSGCSTLNAALSAAATFNTGCAGRAMADVSAAADPGHGGLAVYFPTSKTVSSWQQVGGTSESSPIIASVYAMSASTAGYANAIPYAHPHSLFDITSGSNGSCPTTQWCQAGTGWDGPTGLGTPNGTSGF